MRKEKKYAMPRTREQGLTTRGSVAVCILILLLFVASIATVVWLVRSDAPTVHDKFSTHDSMTLTRTYDGSIIRWYVMTDPDTQVQYLVNDRGGCTPRLDAFGNPKGTQSSIQGEKGYN